MNFLEWSGRVSLRDSNEIFVDFLLGYPGWGVCTGHSPPGGRVLKVWGSGYLVEGAVVLVSTAALESSCKALAINRRKDVKCLVAGARVKTWFR